MRRLKTKTRIVLLDTHAIIHRAYHALPDFTGPEGQPTGALYGLVSMLLKIVTELQPDYIAACYDLPKPTIRHEAYEGYKGTRGEIDEVLVAQIKASRKVFEAFSIPCYEREGFEADDLLGTIAHELREQDVDIVIASGDMDTLQLVDDTRVRVYTLKKGLNDTILYDEDAVRERFGFPPGYIPDYKGLRGDPSDNIKGVPGIGEKTATELVCGFGTIEQLYAVLEKGDEALVKKGIKPRTIALLKEHEEDARFSKALATIRTDAPIAFSLPQKVWPEAVDFKKVLALFDEFGFRSLRERARAVLAVAVDPDFAEAGAEGEMAQVGQEPFDPQVFAEAQVLLWLISSDFTNPTPEDLLAYTQKATFAEAHAELARQVAELGRVQEVYERIEKPLVPVLMEMERHGVLVDQAILSGLAARYRIELKEIEQGIYDAAGREFNVNSPKQLGEVLFDQLKLIPERQKRTAGGQRSTRESELEKIRDAHPIVGAILEYRELKKLLSTYIESLPAQLDEYGRLHAQFLQTGTTTGRLASQNPNLQNIPIHSARGRAIRHAFVAPEGWELVSLDYSQIELRLAAILSGDEKLCNIFRNGRDVHREVAAQVFHVAPEAVDAEMRRRAKVVNFGILYGMGVHALRQQLGTTTAEAHAFYDEYFREFKTLSEYLEMTKGFARKHGYTETLFGRRRQFPEMKSSLSYVRAQAERMAINAPIQGTEGDLIKLAMVEVDRMLADEGARHEASLILSVHDELVYEIIAPRVRKLGEKIRAVMETVVPESKARGVPITAEVKSGPNWGELSRWQP